MTRKTPTFPFFNSPSLTVLLLISLSIPYFPFSQISFLYYSLCHCPSVHLPLFLSISYRLITFFSHYSLSLYLSLCHTFFSPYSIVSHIPFSHCFPSHCPQLCRPLFSPLSTIASHLSLCYCFLSHWPQRYLPLSLSLSNRHPHVVLSPFFSSLLYPLSTNLHPRISYCITPFFLFLPPIPICSLSTSH